MRGVVTLAAAAAVPADFPDRDVLQLLAYAVTALATVPGLYRRSRLAWGVALGFIGAHLLFGVLKYFGLGEDAALTFVVADLVVAAGTPEGWGVGVIAGTGSIAVGRAEDGRTARAGGWGHLIGDERRPLASVGS